MKKIFLAAGVLIMSANITFANTTDGNKKTKAERKEIRKENNDEVSSFTKTQFYEDFPAATDIHYKRTSHFDEVSFVSDKDSLTAYYDIHSTLVGTTQDKTFADLPESAQRDIEKKYSGYQIGKIFKYDDNESNEIDLTMFDMAFDGADNYFVELKKNSETIVVKVDMVGNVSFYKTIM